MVGCYSLQEKNRLHKITMELTLCINHERSFILGMLTSLQSKMGGYNGNVKTVLSRETVPELFYRHQVHVSYTQKLILTSLSTSSLFIIMVEIFEGLGF